MKKFIYGMATIGCVCLLTACDKDTDPVNFAPKLEAVAVSNVTRNSATIEGSIDNFNQSTLEEFGFMYSTVASMPADAVVTVKVDKTHDGRITAHISGLTAGTKYYYCTYANSGATVAKSEVKSFTSVDITPPVLGTFSDGANIRIVELGENSCKVQGLLSDDGGKGNVTVGFVYYKKSMSETDATEVNTTLDSDQTFSLTIDKLEDGCEYCIYPFAKNGATGADLTKGGTVSFTTVKYEKPVVYIDKLPETASAQRILVTAVVLKGTHTVIEQGFCYSYETSQPVIDANSIVNATTDSEGRMSAYIPFEYNDMIYTVRAYAKDDKGEISYSESVQFDPSDFK